jgi:hypothetical protein
VPAGLGSTKKACVDPFAKCSKRHSAFLDFFYRVSRPQHSVKKLYWFPGKILTLGKCHSSSSVALGKVFFVECPINCTRQRHKFR